MHLLAYESSRSVTNTNAIKAKNTRTYRMVASVRDCEVHKYRKRMYFHNYNK